jgi:cell division septal protein FtsQ
LVTYLAYFAKFLFLDNVRVSGADPSVAAQVQGKFKEYIGQHPYGLPQRNIIFFMPNRFANFLTAGNPQILQVTSVRRSLWHTVDVSIVQRLPAYTFQLGASYYIVYSDGTIGDQIQQPQNTLIIDTSAGDTAPQQGARVFTDQQLAFISHIRDNLTKFLPLQISHFELTSLTGTTVAVVTQNGTRFLLDDTGDPSVYLTRLQILWSQLSPAQQAKLAYFDLRFDPKAYGCYRGDPCATIQAW